MTLSILPDTPAPQAIGPAEITAHSVATREIAALVVPGSVVAIHGGVPVSAQFRAPGVQVPLPNSLGGLTARWNGSVAAPILLVRPDEALIQIPWELQGQASAELQLVGRTQATEVETVSLAHAAPELFTLNGHGSGQGLIYSRDSQLADAGNPVWPGSEVVLYCTGLGAVSHQPRTGEPAPSSPRAGTLSRPRMWVHGVEAVVLFRAHSGRSGPLRNQLPDPRRRQQRPGRARGRRSRWRDVQHGNPGHRRPAERIEMMIIFRAPLAP